jgi:hypothetical protein
MRTRRLVWFLITIVLGAAVGLAVGWWVIPVKNWDTKPVSLRSDYKADYALMVAETYQQEGDLNLAVKRLQFLGSESPLRLVQKAILSGQELGYAGKDLETLAHLAQALQAAADQGKP